MPPAPVRVCSQRPFAPSVASVGNDEGDKEMIPGAVHGSPDIFRTAEKISENSANKGCAASHHLKWGPLPRNAVGWIAHHVREEEGK